MAGGWVCGVSLACGAPIFSAEWLVVTKKKLPCEAVMDAPAEVGSSCYGFPRGIFFTDKLNIRFLLKSHLRPFQTRETLTWFM